MNSFYCKEELKNLGFKSIGRNVLISKKASIYGAENISIGSNVRIDDFCILSGNITIGNNVHVSAYVALYGGKKGIIMEDYSGISARGTVYAESDDYNGEFMTNSMIPEEFRNVYGGLVKIEKYSQIGAGCIVLPGVTVNEGAAVGAMSLVIQNVPSWTINVGIPCRVLKKREKGLLEYVQQMEK